MKVIRKTKQMQDICLTLREKGLKIGFVPTMGALHEAHLSLVRRARRENDIVVVSIFVNPKQFGPKEDYLRYPRPFEKDKKLLSAEKIDYLFAPSVEEMYGKDYATYVEVEGLSDILCGKYRPGHFRGVATVVTKLFNIVLADKAYFGEKDYQQLKIIERMVEDLNIFTKIVPCPTVRENDGLAMSSRNIYLSEEERSMANLIYKALQTGKDLIKKGESDREKIISEMKKIIKKIKGAKIQYLDICDPQTLESLKIIKPPARILTAVRIGKTRLIDNVEV